MRNKTISEAIEMIKNGNIAHCNRWDDNEFLFMRPRDYVENIMVIKSIPLNVRRKINKSKKNIELTPYICKYDGEKIINGYILSNEDIANEDWY